MPSRKKGSDKSGPADQSEAADSVNSEERELHMRVYTNWVNDKLKNSDHHVGYLPKDLQDGLILICLLERLTGKKVPGK